VVDSVPAVEIKEWGLEVFFLDCTREKMDIYQAMNYFIYIIQKTGGK
jgi:hypothetical protein